MNNARIHIPDCNGREVAVLGLGRTGVASLHALVDSGARVIAWDDQAQARETLAQSPVARDRVVLRDLREIDWHAVAFLVLSPGIPHEYPRPHPVVAKARDAGVGVVSDIDLLYRACPNATYIGITGTNGKSTTTSLIGHILAQARKRVEIGGNLGQAVLSLAPLEKNGIYVLELSSYQLDITLDAVFDIAVLLNMTPDHLDRHGSMDGYVMAKVRIFRSRHGKYGTAIIGQDDEYTRELAQKVQHDQQRALVKISGGGKIAGGIGVKDGRLYDDIDATSFDLSGAVALPGVHNWQNAAAAYAACRSVGCNPDDIKNGLISFPGLAHRQEVVGHHDGVIYVNDSKATNADAAAKALVCYDKIYWIIGGRPKEGGLEGLDPFYPRICHAYVMGEAEDAFADQLQGKVAVTKCSGLDKAFHLAHDAARAAGGGVVLLSPACASWDQYKNFEERGNHFRDLVNACLADSKRKIG